jgi:flagellar hook-associated protein 2
MSSITFSGLSTGIDTASMIEQLVNLERVPINQLQQRKSNYQNQISIVQNLNSKLQALQTKAQDLDTLEEFLSYETTSSDNEYISVSATGKANPGSYSIDVQNLAEAERRYSKGFTAKDEAGVAGEGTLTIQVGDGDAVDITIEATDTLESIVSKINSADIEASAGILYDGTNYYLQVSGTETGLENAITISESGGTIDMDLEDAAANIVQAAEDSVIVMDGFTITSASNEVTTAIPGVTLTLHSDTTAADVDPVDINISPNSKEIQDKIKGLVDAYNSVVSIIHQEFSFDGEAKGANRLTGDSTLRGVQMQLGQLLSSSLDDLPGSLTALSQLGIKSQNDGTISIDTTALEEAIADDARGVAELFSGTSDHAIEGLGDKLDALIETFVDYSEGILTAKINGMNSTVASIQKSIDRQEAYVDKFEEKLRAQFTSMEVTMSSLMSQSNFLASQQFAW